MTNQKQYILVETGHHNGEGPQGHVTYRRVGKDYWGCRQKGSVQGCLRGLPGTSQGEQSSSGGGGIIGGDGEGNPLPLPTDFGGVVGEAVRRKRPLPLPTDWVGGRRGEASASSSPRRETPWSGHSSARA